MFIKHFDFLSQKLTLFQNKERRHNSVFSGILSLITVLIGIIFFVLFLDEYISKRNPTAYFYNQFVEESGIFPLNSTQIYHYFTMQAAIIDPQIVSIFGINELLIEFTPDPRPEAISHWIYTPCKEGNDYFSYPDMDRIDFNISYCINQYYNNVTQEIIDKSHPNFVYPTISKDKSNENWIKYGIIIQKCKNSTILNGNNCKPRDEMDAYFAVNYGVELKFIDNGIDITDYKEPIKPQLSSITNGIFNSTYTVNHLNFRPANVYSHAGIIFDSLSTIYSYTFEQNEKITYDAIEGEDIICSYYFWIHNYLQIYERNYKRLQDVMGSFGGSLNLVILIASIINYWYAQFIALNDIKIFLDKIDYQRKNGGTIQNNNMSFLNNNTMKSSNWNTNINSNVHRNNDNNMSSNNSAIASWKQFQQKSHNSLKKL